MSELRVVPPYNRKPLPIKATQDGLIWLRITWAILSLAWKRKPR